MLTGFLPHRPVGAIMAGLWFLVGFAAGPVMVLAGLQMTIVTMVAVGFVLLAALFRPTGPRSVDLVSLAGLMVFCVWGRLSQQWSLFPVETDSLLRKAALVFLPIWLAVPLVSVVPVSWHRRFVGGFCLGMVVAVFLVVYEVQYNQALLRWVQHVPKGQPLGINIFNRAVLGTAMLSIPAAGLWIQRGQRGLGIFLPLALFAISLRTDCQTATFGLGVAGVVAILAWFSLKWTRRMVMILFSVGVTMAIPIAWGLGHSGLVQADWLMLSARHRVEVWAYTASHIHDHLWWGYGLGSAEKFFPLARDMSVLLPPEETMRHKHPHSLVMQIWLEAGVFGACCLLGLGYWLINATRRMKPSTQYLAVVSFAAVMAMMAISSFAVWHSWMICILALVVLMVKMADLAPEQKNTPQVAHDLHNPSPAWAYAPPVAGIDQGSPG